MHELVWKPLTAHPGRGGMLAERRPCAALQPYICCFWGGTGQTEPPTWVVPDTCVDLIFRIGEDAGRTDPLPVPVAQPADRPALGRTGRCRAVRLCRSGASFAQLQKIPRPDPGRNGLSYGGGKGVSGTLSAATEGGNLMFFEQYPALDAMLLSYPGAVRDYQPVWGGDRYLVAGKMYAGLLFIAQHKDPRYANHPFVSLKIDPAEGKFYRAQYPADVLPGYYSDKRTWVSIRLDGGLPEAELACLCRRSYDLVVAKLPKSRRP